MKLFIYFFQILIVISASQLAAQKTFDLDDIFRKGTFKTKSLPGFAYMNDGQSYIINKNTFLQINNVVDGKTTGTYISEDQLFDLTKNKDHGIESYEFSADESKVIIYSESEGIYRHSSKGKTYIFDKKTGKGMVIDGGKLLSNPTFSPDGKKVAYTFENNLYYTCLLYTSPSPRDRTRSRMPSSA